MTAFSNYLEDQILNWIKGTSFASAPVNVYVALFNGDPTDTGTGGTEVTTIIRPAGRVTVTFGALSGGSMSNNAIIDFGNSAGSTTVDHVAIYDAVSSGNLLMHGALTSSKSVMTSDPVSFPIGDLTLAVD